MARVEAGLLAGRPVGAGHVGAAGPARGGTRRHRPARCRARVQPGGAGRLHARELGASRTAPRRRWCNADATPAGSSSLRSRSRSAPSSTGDAVGGARRSSPRRPRCGRTRSACPGSARGCTPCRRASRPVSGSTDDAERHGRAALAAATATGTEAVVVWASAALGFLELGRDRPRAAIDHLERVGDERGAWRRAGARPDVVGTGPHRGVLAGRRHRRGAPPARGVRCRRGRDRPKLGARHGGPWRGSARRRRGRRRDRVRERARRARAGSTHRSSAPAPCSCSASGVASSVALDADEPLARGAGRRSNGSARFPGRRRPGACSVPARVLVLVPDHRPR